MTDLLDLFDDDPTPEPPKPAPKPFIDFSKRDGAADARAIAAHAEKRAQPCGYPAGRGDHVCRVGGGLGTCSTDYGRTWTCAGHAPHDFWPDNRP